MWKKNNDFSSEELSQLLNSPQAMALAAMLQKMDTNLLAQAASAASSGDTDTAKALLAPVLQEQKVKDLLRQMGGDNG